MTAIEIEAWMIDRIVDVLGVPPDLVDPNTDFDRLGLDSAAAVALIGDAEDWLGLELEATLAYDFPTVARLAGHLASLRNNCMALAKA